MINVGTISHGTLRTVDQLHAFASELERIAGKSELTRDAMARAEQLDVGGYDESDMDSETVNDLQDALDAAAPAGMYFGTVEGDGSDFGFWHNEAGRRAALADDFARSFERRGTRLFLKNGSPDWMLNACHAAHGDMMPDDWRYRFIAAAVEDIAERLRDDCDTDLDDIQHEIVDAMIPVLNAERTDWLASYSTRAGYCDDAQSEGLVAEDSSIFDRIAAGMYQEASEIYASIVEALNSQAA